MKSDLFSKVPGVKLCNGLKVYYKGCFCAEILYWNDLWQSEEDACNVQLCMITKELFSLHFPGQCCASTQGAAPELAFPRLLQLAGDLTYLCQTWCQPESAGFSTLCSKPNINIIQCSHMQSVSTPHRHHLSAICTGSGMAAGHGSLWSPKHFHIRKVILMKLT